MTYPTGPMDSVARIESRSTCGWVMAPACVRSDEVGGCGEVVHSVSLDGAILVAPAPRAGERQR